MNKLLTTITLLCFSVAANADVWFCLSEKKVSINLNFSGVDIFDGTNLITVRDELGPRGSRVEESSSPQETSFTIDTAKGFKETWRSRGTIDDGPYRGACRTTVDSRGYEFVSCEIKIDGGFRNLILDVRSNKFSYSGIFPEFSLHYVGTCTKA
jgi:hypothetical protein